MATGMLYTMVSEVSSEVLKIPTAQIFSRTFELHDQNQASNNLEYEDYDCCVCLECGCAIYIRVFSELTYLQ
jgi:hypothetical protein